VHSYEQLKHELEAEYLSKRSTAHLQLEFNSLKQKTGENTQDFKRRVLAMELFESMEEDQNHTVEQQRTILENIKLQALHNFQIGLHEDIKLLVRSVISNFARGDSWDQRRGKSKESESKGQPISSRKN